MPFDSALPLFVHLPQPFRAYFEDSFKDEFMKLALKLRSFDAPVNPMRYLFRKGNPLEQAKLQDALGVAMIDTLRLTVTKCRSACAQDLPRQCTQLSQVVFCAGGKRIEVSAVSNAGGENPAGQTCANLVSGTADGKWLDFKLQPVVFELGESCAPDTYTFATADDYPERDPARWVLEGRVNGGPWCVLDDRRHADQEYSAARNRMTPPMAIRPIDTLDKALRVQPTGAPPGAAASAGGAS